MIRNGNNRPQRRFEDKFTRFASTIAVDPISKCWNWMGAVDRDGYGVFTATSRYWGSQIKVKAHRFSMFMFSRPCPDDLVVDHLCRNRKCVNPTHLEAVSNKENLLRGVGFCGVNVRKTHCHNGHEFNELNTYKIPNGGRSCKACAREGDKIRKRKYRAEKRACANSSI